MRIKACVAGILFAASAALCSAQYSGSGFPSLTCSSTVNPHATWMDSTVGYLWTCQNNANKSGYVWLTNNTLIGLPGQEDGSSALAGYVGEIKSSLIASGSAVSLTTVTPANVTSITLTPGDWDVEATVNFVGGSSTIAAGALHEIGLDTTTATLPTNGTEVYVNAPAVTTTSAKFGAAISRQTFTVSTNTTVYLVAEGTFTAGTEAVYGNLVARRVR